MTTPYAFEDYRVEANRRVNEHGDILTIYKLIHNIPLTENNYRELERILVTDLGSK